MKPAAVFEDRFDPRYFLDVVQRLDRIVDEARPDDDLARATSGKLTRRAEIAYAGLSGSLLLGVDGQPDSGKPRGKAGYGPNDVSRRFETLFNDVEALNAQGVALDVKILLAYPYSDFVRQMIVASTAQNRVTIKSGDRDALPTRFSEYTPDYEDFPSDLKKFQKESIQYICDDYINKIREPNRFLVRFTPIPLNYSGLFINCSAYYDTYCYAKADRRSPTLASRLPLIKVVDGSPPYGDRDPTKDDFRSLLNDFDYMWTHPASMFFEDVVLDYDRPRIEGPQKVQTTAKLAAMAAQASVGPDQVGEWRFSVEQLIAQSTINSSQLARKESIFIACGWERRPGGRSQPNRVAVELKRWILDGFKGDDGKPIVGVHLVDATEGQFISDAIFSALASSSHGIVILCHDHIYHRDDLALENPKSFSRPSAIHELGFLGHKLGKLRMKGDEIISHDMRRIYVLKDQDTHEIGNLANIMKEPFDSAKPWLSFARVMMWIGKPEVFSTVSAERALAGVQYAMDRLTEKFHDVPIAENEVPIAEKEFRSIMEALNDRNLELTRLIGEGGNLRPSA